MTANSSGIVPGAGRIMACLLRSARLPWLRRWVWLVALSGFLWLPAKAGQSVPLLYTIEAGDTLWGIAARFLDDPLRWPELLVRNPQLVGHGALLVGETLVVAPDDETTPTQLRMLPIEVRRPTVRDASPAPATAMISPDAITPFLTYPLLMGEIDSTTAGHVVTGLDGDVLLGQFSRFYAQSLPPSENDIYTIFRPDQALIHPLSGERLGTAARFLGTAQLDTPGRVAKLTIVSAVEEISPGDRLIPRPKKVGLPYLYPTVPQVAVDAHVISTFGSISGAGDYAIVVISAGSEDGVAVGNILTALHPNRTLLLTREVIHPQTRGDRCRVPTAVRTTVNARLLGCSERLPGKRQLTSGNAELVDLPEGRSGELLVFRVFDRLSYALVRRTERAVHSGDRVVSPGA